MNYNEIVNKYSKSFKKAGVTPSVLAQLEHSYIITETITRYENGKKIDETSNEITADYFANAISAIYWFNDRVTKNYSSAGYIVSRLSCISPDKTTKIVRDYNYTYIG